MQRASACLSKKGVPLGDQHDCPDGTLAVRDYFALLRRIQPGREFVTCDDVFLRATHRTPFPYQRALALAADLPEALSAPTGAGKTAAVALGWLYRRRRTSIGAGEPASATSRVCERGSGSRRRQPHAP